MMLLWTAAQLMHMNVLHDSLVGIDRRGLTHTTID